MDFSFTNNVTRKGCIPVHSSNITFLCEITYYEHGSESTVEGFFLHSF